MGSVSMAIAKAALSHGAAVYTESVSLYAGDISSLCITGETVGGEGKGGKAKRGEGGRKRKGKERREREGGGRKRRGGRGGKGAR